MRVLKWTIVGCLLFWGSMLGAVVMAAGGGSPSTSPSPPLTELPPSARTAVIWPVTGTISDPFGWRLNPQPPYNPEFHTGIDIAAGVGTPVRAATNGQIIMAGWSGGYGNLIILAAPSGVMVTYYGHLSEFAVRKGDSVAQGQIIGYVGNTGRSTGPHLHFELRPLGRAPVDPLGVLGVGERVASP